MRWRWQAQGVARATKDIDFLVEPLPDNVDRLRAALREVFDDDSVEEITSADLAGDCPVVRYGLRKEGSLSTLLAGVPVPVATVRVLFEMRRGTLRPQDRADAR